MNTTDVFVEQVLIGGMVLAVIGLFSPEWAMQKFAADGSLGAIFTGAVLIGVAYLVGVLADRVLDTILSELENWNRLKFAATERSGSYASDDPFPEGRMRTRVRSDEGQGRYAEYLRSRMRLTRGVAVLSPAIALALFAQDFSVDARIRLGMALCSVYLIVWGVAALGINARKKKDPPYDRGWVFLWKVPSTRVGRANVDRHYGSYDNRKVHLAIEPLIAFLYVATSGMQAFALGLPITLSWVGQLAAAAVVPIVALWSWMRISTTFFRHIAGADDFLATQT